MSKLFKNSKIGTKLLVIGGLLILIPIVLISILSVYFAGTALEKSVNEQLGTRSREIAKLVDDVMRDQLRFTTALSVSPEIVKAAEALSTQSTAADRAPLDAAERYLKKLLATGNLGENVQLIGLVNLEGTISAATASKYIGVRIPDRTYFQKARDGHSNIGEVAINKVTGNPFISLAAPVRSADGRIRAVLMYIYDIGFLNNLVTDEKIGKSGYAFMIDKTGLLIAHPNPKHLMKTNLSTLDGMKTFTGNMMAGKAGVDRYVFEGIRKTAGYAPVPSARWSVGLTMPEDEYMSSVHRMTLFSVVIGAAATLLSLVIFFLFSHLLVKRLRKGVAFAEKMSDGDLTDVLETGSRDEIGVLTDSLNHMADNISRMIRQIRSGSSSLFVTSSELKNISEVLSTSSEDAAERANSVSAAATEMQSNIESVAAAMEQATSGIDAIAAAVEEMNTNIRDITERLNKTRENTNRAVEVSASSSEQVSDLKKAASEIAGITETIYSIADKTSLLALNATIEAARAGESGKGFAVVAGEIKELAQQVSDSTGDIASKVSAIQGTTETTIKGIAEIVEVISLTNEDVDSIASSMQQQNYATEEVSGNISQTSAGILEINKNISQAAEAVAQVASEITTVNRSANDISSSVHRVEKSSDYLISFAGDLENRVQQFRVNEVGFSSGPVKLAHSTWKKKLSELLSGKQPLAESDITSHHDCEFGKWYFGEGKDRYSDRETFRMIDPSHASVHEAARKITRLYNEGKSEEAATLFEDFSGITDELFALLEKLEEETSEE